jgi:hypothetical protein
MDDEEKSPALTWDIVEVLFVLLLVFLILQALVALPGKMRTASPETRLGKIGTLIGINESIGKGSIIENAKLAYIHRVPDGDLVAVMRKAVRGTVIGGPATTASGVWWQTAYTSGERGWVLASEIQRVKNGGAVGNFASSLWYFIKFVGTFASLLLIFGIVYATLRLNELRALDHKTDKKLGQGTSETPLHEENKKWIRVMEHLESHNANDWRLAILEADIMLDDMLEVLGYRGSSMGEKLKSIEKSDFTNLDKAWEAHKIRNLIAHEGADFQISQREARRVIYLYRDAFNEFRYI